MLFSIMGKAWSNYLFNRDYCAIIDETGNGFSFYRDPKYNRLISERGIILQDDQRKSRKSLVVSRESQCSHNFGYSVIGFTQNQIKIETTYYVPLNSACERWLIKVTNASRKKRALIISPTVKFVAGDIAMELHYPNIMKLYNRACFDRKKNMIVAYKMPYPGRPIQTYCYFTSSRKATCPFKKITGEDMMGILGHKLTLRPNETKEFAVTLGFSIKKLSPIPYPLSSSKKELTKVKSYFQSLLNQSFIKTPSPSFDLMVNLWGKYQLFAIRNFRGTSPYHGAEGGIGYRDRAQDIEAFAALDPKWAKEKLIELFKYQYNSGHAVSGFSEYEGPWENREFVSGKSDMAVWLIFATCTYLKETGDFALLKKVLPFIDGDRATVLEHLNRAINYLLKNKGPHGLPLIGKADWNDAFDRVGIKGRGESVWLAMAVVKALKEMIELYRHLKKPHLVRRLSSIVHRLSSLINKIGWDGRKYIAAIADNGQRIGAGKEIHLNPQTWAIISGIVPKNRIKKVWQAIAKLETPYGPKLNHPAYKKYNPNIGRVSAFAPGTKENAAIFSHAAAFKILAEAMSKKRSAFDSFQKISPLSKIKKPKTYKAEPYVWAEYVIGPDNPRYGEGEFTWNTGTAGWMYRLATEWILGVRATYDGLIVDPVLPKSWKNFYFRRKYRGKTHEIIGQKNGKHVIIRTSKKPRTKQI